MSVLNGLRSWLDIAWVRMTTASSSGSKFFGREGWGDMEAQDALWAKIKADGVDGFPDIDDVVETEAGRRTVVLTFPSPCKEFLPPVCHEVRVHVIEPKDRGRPGEPVKHAGVVIVLGHLYEHSLAHRVKVTRRLVKRGFVVVLPIMPYYMERAPLLQRKSYFSSVADLLTGAGAGAVEQAKLVQLLAKRYPDVPLGISGTSYGSVIGLAAATLLEHEKIAISAVAPPAGPATLLNGAMRNKISFRKLGEPGPKKRKEAKAELRRVLNSRGLDDFLRGHPECAIHSMYLIFGRADRIAPRYVAAAALSWDIAPHSELHL